MKLANGIGISHLFAKRPADITEEDLQRVCSEGWCESDVLEFKELPPSKSSGTSNPWQAQEKFEEYARNKILEEIIAFANSHGGWLILGVQEGGEKPNAAIGLTPINNCEEFADRLRKACRDCIDPQLPSIEISAVPFGSSADGSIVVYTPKSRLSPHRLTPTLQCYVRRHDRTERMTMREIQDLTLSLLRGSDYVMSEMNSCAERLRELYNDHKDIQPLNRSMDDYDRNEGFVLRFSAVPVAEMMFDGILSDPDKFMRYSDVDAKVGQRNVQLIALRASGSSLPVLRGIRVTTDRNRETDIVSEREIYSSGVLEYRLAIKSHNDHGSVLYISWVMSMAVNSMISIQRIREATGAIGLEYVMQFEIIPYGSPVTLGGYSDRDSYFDPGEIDKSISYPIIPIRSVDGFEEALRMIERDVFNSANKRVESQISLDFESIL